VDPVTWSSRRSDLAMFGAGDGGSSGHHARVPNGRGDSVHRRPGNREAGMEGGEGGEGTRWGRRVEERWPRWRTVGKGSCVVEESSFLFSLQVSTYRIVNLFIKI
jgi:hypothetical protein